jgi:TRAP-type C4-dicarboxylate transport system permease small subunit
LLRQLVIITGFLGAMLATRQRSHITVDAVGKLLKGRTEHVVHTITSLVAAVVCVFLALSGWDLVSIGREFPRQLIPWLKDWHFQLAFPIGWGLLAFHFAMRTVESAVLARENPAPEQISPDDDSEASVLDANAHEEAL